MYKKLILPLIVTILLQPLVTSASLPGCPIVCPTSAKAPAQFCAVNVRDNLSTNQLCVTGNAQIGGNLNVCGTITGNFIRAYGYFYNEDFSVALDPVLPSKIPVTNTGLALNVTNPNATDIVIQLAGVYLIAVMLEPNTALNVSADYEIQKNGVTIPGSVFNMGAGISGIQISTQALVAAVPTDVITVITTGTGQETTLTGISSIIIDKIA